MTTVATLLARLLLDTSDYEGGLAEAENRLKSFSGNMQNVGQKMQQIGGVMTASITMPIVGGFMKAVSAASDLQESQNAVNTVFGDAASIILDYSQTSAQAVGLAASDFNQLSAVTGSFLQNLGYDASEAALESINLTERASDMASVFNTDVTQALQAIQSGLKGEFNPLEQFGVKMNASAIAARALEMGLAPVTVNVADMNAKMVLAAQAQEEYNRQVAWYGEESDQAILAFNNYVNAQAAAEAAAAGVVGELDDNAKAQAALALIMEQTDRIAGDFANTSDQLANSQRIMKAEIQDAVAELGTALLPIVLQVVTAIRDLVDRFRNLSPEQQKMILLVLGIIAVLGPLITVIGTVISVIGAVTGFIMGLSAPILILIGVLVLLVAAWRNNWGGIQEKLAAVWAVIQPIIQTLIAWLQENIPIALQALSDFWNNVLLPAIQTVWAWIQEHLFPLFSAIAELIYTVVIIAFEALAGLWQNVIQPAIQTVWEWLETHLMPILTRVGEWVRDTVVPAFETLGGVLDIVTGWIQALVGWLGNLTLPDWLTPGSPTPFELGLRGINKELDNLSSRQMPQLSASLDLSAPSLVGVGVGASGTGNSVVFHPGAIVVNDQASGERILDLLKRAIAGEVV